MKKGVLAILLMLIIASASPNSERNITERVVLLHNGAIKIRFHNMGVDANWGGEVLDNAAKALPVIEDLIGVDFPQEVASVEIYGTEGEGGIYAGGNDGTRIVMLAKHPANSTYIYHELVHYWTIYYHVPWALKEGYAILYSYLAAKQFGEDVVAYNTFKSKSLDAFEREVKENIVYIKTDQPRNLVLLNAFDYRQESDEKKIDYFYGMSGAIMFTLAGVYEDSDFHLYGIGVEKLKEVNKRMMSSGFDDSVGGIGTIQYIELLREMTGKTMVDLFMPVFFSSWDDAMRSSFARSFSYLASAKAIIGTNANPNMDTGIRELANGNPEGAINFFLIAIKTYYEELEKAQIPSPTPAPTPAPKTGIQKLVSTVTESAWFLPIVLILIIIIIFVSLGLYLYSRSRREEAFDRYLEEIKKG